MGERSATEVTSDDLLDDLTPLFGEVTSQQRFPVLAINLTMSLSFPSSMCM